MLFQYNLFQNNELSEDYLVFENLVILYLKILKFQLQERKFKV